MDITIHNLKPRYMSEPEVSGSDIYLQPEVCFRQGQKYMVTAHSGQGKTSLLNFIYGISHNFDGSIVYSLDEERKSDLQGRSRQHAEDGGNILSAFYKPLDAAYIQMFRLRKLSFLFQDLCLFPELTAMENVQLKNRLTNYKKDSEIAAMLDSVLPCEKKSQPVRSLSLGQRQRVAAVRSLCQPFNFLLLDEPFSHIDHQNAELLARLIITEVEKQNAGLIVTALDPIDLFCFDHILHL